MNRFSFGACAGLLIAGNHFAQGADLTSYSVRKGLVYEQSSAAAPTPMSFSPALFVVRADGNTEAVNSITLSTPSDFFPQFEIPDIGGYFEFSIPGSTQDLNSFFPNGNYTFSIDSSNDGFKVSTLPLTTAPFPTVVPQVLNYAATQSVDPATAFTINFNPFTGAAGSDHFELDVFDSNRDLVFSARGTGTSATIPAGRLIKDESYEAHLRFVHDTKVDTTSYPGASGGVGVFTETLFSIETGTNGSGGNDTTPPSLFFVTPSNGSTGAALNTPVNFLFSEPMARQQQIQWSANVSPSNFSYSWSNGDQALTAIYAGGFPANSTISYTLVGGATGFKDLAGNALDSAGASGSFSTGSSGGGQTNNPCTTTNQPPDGTGGGNVFKSLSFVQTGNTAPVPDAENPAMAIASYKPATNQTVSSVNVTGPNNFNITLESFFGTFLAFQEFTNGAALDAAIPSGAYTITATGAGTGTLNMGSASALPVPRFSNLVELAGFDPTKAFTLQFSPFTGAAGTDSISISISGGTNHFYAPDYCLNRQLPITATSVIIPANTFRAGDKLSGGISFSKFSSNTSSIPNTVLSAGTTVETTFNLEGGTNTVQVRWISAVKNQDKTATFTAQVATGGTLAIEGSTNLTQWSQVTTVPVTNGTAIYSTPTATPAYRFFRGRVQ